MNNSNFCHFAHGIQIVFYKSSCMISLKNVYHTKSDILNVSYEQTVW